MRTVCKFVEYDECFCLLCLDCGHFGGTFECIPALISDVDQGPFRAGAITPDGLIDEDFEAELGRAEVSRNVIFLCGFLCKILAILHADFVMHIEHNLGIYICLVYLSTSVCVERLLQHFKCP